MQLNRQIAFLQRIFILCGLLSFAAGWVVAYRQGETIEIQVFAAFLAGLPPLGSGIFAHLLWQNGGARSSLVFSYPACFFVILFATLYGVKTLSGPPNPDSAAHLALFAYPVLECIILVMVHIMSTIVSVLIGGGRECLLLKRA